MYCMEYIAVCTKYILRENNMYFVHTLCTKYILVCKSTYSYWSNSHFFSNQEPSHLQPSHSDACLTLCVQHPAYPKSHLLSGSQSKACHVQTATAMGKPHRHCCCSCNPQQLQLHNQQGPAAGKQEFLFLLYLWGMVGVALPSRKQCIRGFCQPCSWCEPRRDTVLGMVNIAWPPQHLPRVLWWVT